MGRGRRSRGRDGIVLDGMGGDRLGTRRFRLGGVVKFQRSRVWRCKDGCIRRKGWAGDDTNKEDEQERKAEE